MNMMRVTKRNGEQQLVSFDKVTKRLKVLCEMEPKLKNVDYTGIAQKVISRIYDGVNTYELDELAAEQCTQKGVDHINYSILASRIAISNNQKRTSPSFSETISILYNNTDVNGKPSPLIADKVYSFVKKNKTKLNSYIDYRRDYNFNYFALKTLEKAYLMKINNIIVERIQHMFMRVAAGLYPNSIRDVLETYDLLSQKYFIHATPTLFHSGTPKPQLLSCFLLEVGDSVEGMYTAMKNCALISKWAGGIGCHIHSIRGKNSVIRSTNGKSNGIVPMLRVFNDVARHINQSGKRNGSFAMYLEPWHPDIMEFLECKKNHGDEDARARDLFYAMWIPDLFMERVMKNENWTLFCPDKCKGLVEAYGQDFKNLYERYESDESNIIRTLPAREIWISILNSQMETGTPYICYKDACNLKSNQKNLGTIKSSNLCTEIIEYSNENEYACCTLASIGLPKYLIPFDKSSLGKVTIYTIEGCKACEWTKRLLDSHEIGYTLINVVDDDDKDEKTDIDPNTMTMTELYNTIRDVPIESAAPAMDFSFPIIYSNREITEGQFVEEEIGGFTELYNKIKHTFDFVKLKTVVRRIVKNLNNVIDLNFYPVEETKRSNLKHRPIGIGIQGLADVYAQFRYSFDSDEAKQLNKEIFATIYYSACQMSMELAKERNERMVEFKSQIKGKILPELYDEKALKSCRGVKLYHELKVSQCEVERDEFLGSYSSFNGSPISQGKFQFDLWKQEPLSKVAGVEFDWEGLRNDIMEHGMRNSLLMAPMPTASTSQILGNNECIEPFTSNIYSRSTLAGQFVIINKYLQQDLLDIGLWDNRLKDQIIIDDGSIQNIKSIPRVIRNLYKISWDLSMKDVIDQAADRAIYICQSQSLNLWVKNPDTNKLSSMHMYSWKKGLKTGMYYLRRRAVVKAQQFSIDPEQNDDCLMCGS